MQTGGKAKNLISAAFSFASSFIVSAIAICAACLIVMKICGFEFFTVESGSMYPAYPKDSLVFVKKTDPGEIARGDVITFVLNSDGTLATHRVIEADSVNETFTTKGDANASPDANPVLWGNVVGRVVFGIPKAGAVFRVITDPAFRPYLIGAFVAFGAACIIGDIYAKRREKQAYENEEQIEK